MNKLLVIFLIAFFSLACVWAFTSFNLNMWLHKVNGNEQELPNYDLTGSIKDDELDVRVKQTVNSMSIDQMVGQLLMVGFSGTEPDYYISRMINLRHIGGIVLFGRNIENIEQLAKLNNDLQRMSVDNNGLPLFIAIDQEGGEVDRLKGHITSFPAPPDLGKIEPDLVKTAAAGVAKELKAVGINVNLAPVIDLAFASGIMKNRSFGSEPDQVSEKGIAVVNGHRSGGVISCVKHFPGLGRAMNDPHLAPVNIEFDLAEALEFDLYPFSQSIQNHVEMIMVSHAVYPALDKENPATMSPTIQQTLLRKTLGYRGLILTDDLEMGAVTTTDTIGNSAVKAIKAGADIVLICHTPAKQKEAYDAIVAAVNKGEISTERLRSCVERVVALKYAYNLDKNNQVDMETLSGVIKNKAHQEHAITIQNKIK